MPVEGTSTTYTGPGFLYMSYLAFANITEILGEPELAKEYRAKAATVAEGINTKFLNNETGAYAASGARDAAVAGSAMTYSPGTAVAYGEDERTSGKSFCGQSGLNPAPNPGKMNYEVLTLKW